MALAFQAAVPSTLEESWKAELLSNPSDIAALKERAQHLLTDQASIRDPGFFLASIAANWTPIVVTVSRAGSTVGIVYAKERKLAGLPTGLIYADATLDAMVIAGPADREAVLEAALHRLLERPGTRGLRILIPPSGFEREAIQRVLDSRPVDVHYAAVANHCVLDLEPSYDAFLQKLGQEDAEEFPLLPAAV